VVSILDELVTYDGEKFLDLICLSCRGEPGGLEDTHDILVRMRK
jgi:hypothetical protein